MNGRWCAIAITCLLVAIVAIIFRSLRRQHGNTDEPLDAFKRT